MQGIVKGYFWVPVDTQADERFYHVAILDED